MAIKMKTETKKTTIPVELIKVDRAKAFDEAIMFDITVFDCVKIYGCSYRTYNDKQTGEEKGIIGFPSKKGNDDKYYNHAYFFVTDEMLAEIEKQIEALI